MTRILCWAIVIGVFVGAGYCIAARPTDAERCATLELYDSMSGDVQYLTRPNGRTLVIRRSLVRWTQVNNSDVTTIAYNTRSFWVNTRGTVCESPEVILPNANN